MDTKKIVVIGGGTGTVAVLSGLKDYIDLDIKVIVNMTDDGGSNAIVRDEFGLLPLSDLRKSIIALAESGNTILQQLFTFRFSKGNGLTGHTMGNLIMMALSEIYGSEEKAVEMASELFKIKGEVIPVTTNDVKLVAEYDNGKKVFGEHLIDEPVDEEIAKAKITNLYTEPTGKITSKAKKAIKEADFIIAGPGDLYTSTLANIIITGFKDALRKSKAKKIFITNLMTKQGQTHWMTSKDMVDEFAKYSGTIPDIVINHKGKFSKRILKKYELQNEFPIEDNLESNNGYDIVRVDLTSDSEIKAQKGDKLKRSLIRHDASKLGRILYGLIIYDDFQLLLSDD